MREPFDWQEDFWEDFWNQDEKWEWATEEEIEEQKEAELDFLQMEIPGANFLFNSPGRKIKNNFSSVGFEDIIYKNPAFTIGDMEMFQWMGEALEDNDA